MPRAEGLYVAGGFGLLYVGQKRGKNRTFPKIDLSRINLRKRGTGGCGKDSA